jgi:hypothetical protein
MVVLTDGDIFGDPLNLTTVINSPKMQGVERFAIGVRARSQETPLTLHNLGGEEPLIAASGSSVSKPSLFTNTPLLLVPTPFRSSYRGLIFHGGYSSLAEWVGRAHRKVPGRGSPQPSPGR